MKLFNILLAISLFIFGWVAGQITENIDLFHLSFDVPLFNVINLVVVSWLGWYISYCIQTIQRKTKSKIDLYSSKIDDIDSELKRLCIIIKNSNGAYYPEIVSMDKYCRTWYKKIYDSFNEEIKKNFKNDNETINKELKQIRLLLTDSSILPNDSNNINISNDIVTYSSTRKSEIDIIIDSIRHKLYKLKQIVIEI